ncbi:MAG: hypothetical protein GF364_06740 [Candidatus Lokiarchaeota archaeon]|nr:hypothetical protein [Candidatus Lokiarchaeota archaeon]
MHKASNSLQKKLQELSKIIYRAATILPKCKSCGTCIKYCPLELREFNKEGKAITISTSISCGGCTVCYHRCPEQAIKLVRLSKNTI